MSSPAGGTRHRSVLPAFVLAHLIFAFLSVWALSRYFYLSGRVVLLHVLLVAGIAAIIIATLAVGLHRRWFSNTQTTRVLVSAALAVGVSTLALLYLLDWAGNFFWSDNLNYQVARQYAALMLPNRAPFFVAWWVYGAGAAVTGLLCIAYWSRASVVLSSIEALFPTPDVTSPRGTRHGPTQLLVTSLIVLAYAAGTGRLAWSLHRDGLLNNEPIVGFFLKSDSLFNFSQYAGDRGRNSEGAEIRAAYPRGQTFARRNVFVIIVDSLRADHMGVYGYSRSNTPFLSRQTEGGRLKRVELALSTCAETNCGVISTLNSKALAHFGNDDFRLDQLLRDQGYQVYRILSGNHDWRGLRQRFGDEQALYFDSTNSTHYELNDDRVLLEGLEHVPDFRGTPAFFQFHLMSVHATGVKHDAFRRYEPSTLRRNFDWILKGDDRLVLTNNYDNGVVEADATIEQIMSALERKGYLTNALGLILSDHGEKLGERGPLAVSHVRSLYQEDIQIPLLIYDDAAAEYGNLTLARQIDVAPTVVDRLGLPTPSSWEGRSLAERRVAEYSFHQTRHGNACYAVVDHGERATYKYIRFFDSLREELYDLTVDPHEQHDISAAMPPLVEDLRTRLREHLIQASTNGAAGTAS